MALLYYRDSRGKPEPKRRFLSRRATIKLAIIGWALAMGLLVLLVHG